MPKILEDRRQAILRNNPNMSKSSSYAIATSSLQKQGKLPKAYKGGRVDVSPKNFFASGGAQLPRSGHESKKP